jgi:hypothetical protein
MLKKGDQVPHFDVRTVHSGVFSYSTIWQHRNLVLVVLPADESAATEGCVSQLTDASLEFSEHGADCVITRDVVAGIPAPGVLVADRWGEIGYVAHASETVELPPPRDLLDWVAYVQTRCPECEGETK